MGDGVSMSESEDKDQAVSEKAVPVSGGQSKKGSGGVIILFFVIGLAASLVVGWILFPKVLYSQKEQPIDFNHSLHAGFVDKGCESCHFFREDGTYAGVPKLAQCRDCHEEVQGSNPEETKFVEQYVKKNIEVPWLVNAKQPNCVYFSHAAHVKSAKLECATCHGPIGESEHLKVYRQNRITGYSRDIWGENIAGIKKNSWDRMKMDDCTECHQKKKVAMGSVQTQKEGCFVCHK